jgi:hypothetical protein
LLFAFEENLGETVQFDSSKVRDAVQKPTTRDLGQQKPPAFDPEATVVTPAATEATQQGRARDTGNLEPPQPTQYYSAQSSAPAQSATPPPPPPPSGPIPPPQTGAPLPPPLTPTSGPIAPPAPAQAPSGPIAPSPAMQAAVTPQPSQALPPVAPAKKKSKLPLILGVLVVLFVLGIGVVVAAYFVVVRPRLASRTVERPVASAPTETGPSIPTTAATPTEASKPSNEPPPYNPPADAEQFVNSKDELSGKLAENFVAFNFYYPNRWQKDPKAATGESPNFVEVHRQLDQNSPQESMAVSWYDLQGEEHSFEDLARKKSAQLEKLIGQYRKVSEGPTKIGTYDGYELRFEGRTESADKGELSIWGRVVWLPSSEGSKTGVALLMYATSLTPDVHSIDDMGVKGELPMLLESFRFGK